MFADISGQRIGAVFKGQERQVFLGVFTIEDGTDLLSRNVRKQLPHDTA
jgi:hypothetical protein